MQSDATAGTLPLIFVPSGSARTCGCENLTWTELTRRGRTFEFSRELHIRVLEEEGGWAFESDDPELMGFGLTRSEAEQSFCVDFAACWDEIACQDDEMLTQDATEMKQSLLALVKAIR
jgi:hypothetical protein